MRLLLLLGCVAKFFTGILAQGCPFSQSYMYGMERAHDMSDTKAKLIKHNYVIAMGEPAYSAWTVSPQSESIVNMYNKTNALLFAQQFYLEENHFLQKNSNYLKLKHLKTITESVPIADRCLPIPTCNFSRIYTETTGKCNNMRNPKWGSAYSPYSRLHAADYDDGIYTIRRSVNNKALPSPRLIGNILANDKSINFQPWSTVNYGSLIFGQYITHDSGRRETYQNDAGGNGLNCCSKDYQRMLPDKLSYHGCYAVEVPRNDPFYSQFNMRCLSYIRSQPIFPNDCKLGSADLTNTVTSFLDQSTIYGSTEPIATALRTFESGLLRIDNNIMALKPNCTGPLCYFTGEGLGSFFTTLGLWHTIFIRYHNKIANRLEKLNKHWNDDRLFQETRRILTAVYQNIIFNEWLPYYIGADNAYRRGVSCKPSSTFCGEYDPKVDPSTLNEFAQGAFRLFHVNTPKNVNFYNSNYKLIKSEPLSNHTNGVNILETSLDEILRGLVYDAAYIGNYPEDLRNTVFDNYNKDGIGLDLLSVDIARGRDHGLSPYHVYLNMSTRGGHVVDSWDDLIGIIPYDRILILKTIYKSVKDIDLFVGLLLEKKNFSYAGQVTKYILEEQFYRFKFGDRFFYSFANSRNPFTEDQIKEINSQKFANLLCQNSDVHKMLPKAFEIESLTNQFVKCNTMHSINFDLWKSKS